MTSLDRIPVEVVNSENIIISETENKHEESIVFSIAKTEYSYVSICQELFNKFEHFKQETTVSLTSENMKEILNQSISLWKELLQMAKYANEKDKSYFDANRAVVTKVFVAVKETDLFNDDIDFARQKFFDYLDLLNTHEIEEFLISSSLSTLTDSILDLNINAILFITSTLCDCILLVDDDIVDQYNTLLNALRVHIDQKFQSTKEEVNGDEKLITVQQRILLFLWHLTDHTIVIPCLLRAGYGKSVIEWLKYSALTDAARQPLVSIVHNLARHDNGADELNKYGAIETINHMQQLESVRQSNMLLLNTMSLALLSTPNQIKADPTGTKTILDQLLQITINASTSEKYRYNGFHISEPLAVLAKLFIDDVTINYVMNQVKTSPPSNATSTIQLFSDLIISFHSTISDKNRLQQFTFIALLNILWSISFHEHYQQLLKQQAELINIIQNVAIRDSQLIIAQYVPRSMQHVKKAVDGILFNLGTEIPLAIVSYGLPIIEQKKPLVMLSYCHANSLFCDKILELLDQKADLFDVWIDKRCCKTSADVWESIAKGIKNAKLIVSIVSSEYVTSKACRQEVIYAKDRLNKRFLPVYLEKPEISDWLDIRIAEYKYVRFQNTHLQLNKQKSEEFLSTLIQSISVEHKSQSHLTNKNNHTSTMFHEEINNQIGISESSWKILQPNEIIDIKSKPISRWTQQDIHYWFTENHICPNIRDMYQFKTGGQMITYAECFKNGWQKQYERYSRRYAKLYPDKELLEHEFALFISALKELSVETKGKFFL